MASLRARLTIGLVCLCAAGLVVVGVVTYVEQRSTLEGRIDQQARSASPTLSRALDNQGLVPGAPGRDAPSGRGGPPGPGGGPHGGGGGPAGDGGAGTGLSLPPGTYGQRRDARGRVLGHPVVISYGSSWPAPKLPANVPLGHPFTVGSVGSSGLRYRVFAAKDPEDTGVTVVAIPQADVDRTLHRLLIVELLVIGGVLLLVGIGAFAVVRVGLRPLDRMGTIADEIAAGKLSKRVSPATPRTEVGRLGLALNAMLERLEAAFGERERSESRLRQFLADASHELRTPLASIRGYAELFRMGAASDPEDTSKAMRRIEDEAKRMGVLVEDLLTLARLDQVHEPVRQRVDMAELAADAVDDARAVAPERAITLDGAGPAIVIGDAHQLRQVLGNVMRNALTHTPPGTPIDVGVQDSADEVVVEVRDHGPGLPVSRDQQLFERFWRSERGRERGKAGAGLGLAIVGGIVAAHGGRVTAENAEGGGARFVIRLDGAPVETLVPLS